MDWHEVVIVVLSAALSVVSTLCWHLRRDIREVQAYFDDYDYDLAARRSTPAGGGPC